MTFGILKKDKKVDKVKTTRLKKQIHKSCEKISKTLFEEIKKVHHLTKEEELSTHFWGSLSYHAFLRFTEMQDDIYVSAEIADLFGSKNLKDPSKHVLLVDISKAEKTRAKHLEKTTNKAKKS